MKILAIILLVVFNITDGLEKSSTEVLGKSSTEILGKSSIEGLEKSSIEGLGKSSIEGLEKSSIAGLDTSQVKVLVTLLKAREFFIDPLFQYFVDFFNMFRFGLGRKMNSSKVPPTRGKRSILLGRLLQGDLPSISDPTNASSSTPVNHGQHEDAERTWKPVGQSVQKNHKKEGLNSFGFYLWPTNISRPNGKKLVVQAIRRHH